MPRKPPVFERHPARYTDAIENGVSRGFCHYVSDGDTADFLLDLGYYQYAYTSLRLLGIDTPELHGTTGQERKTAFQAKLRTEQLILNKPVLVRTYKDTTSFERFIAAVYFALDEGECIPGVGYCLDLSEIRWYSLGAVLIGEGLGVVMTGRD